MEEIIREEKSKNLTELINILRKVEIQKAWTGSSKNLTELPCSERADAFEIEIRNEANYFKVMGESFMKRKTILIGILTGFICYIFSDIGCFSTDAENWNL